MIFFVILNECERSTGILRSAQNDVENFEELHFLGSFHSDFNEFTEFVGRASQQKSHIFYKLCDSDHVFSRNFVQKSFENTGKKWQISTN